MKDVTHYVALDVCDQWWPEYLAAQGQRELEAWLRKRADFADYCAARDEEDAGGAR